MNYFIAYIVLGAVCTSVIIIYQYVSKKHFKDLSKEDLIQRAIAWIFLWPIIIIYTLPQSGLNTLFEKHEAFDFKGAIDRRHNELLALWESPPECSNIVETNGYDESTYESLNAKFVFNAHDIEAHLNELGPKSEFSVLNQDAIILKWINQRNADDNRVCTVPEELDRFNSTANSLLIKGLGKVHCDDCQTEYTANQLNCISDKLSAGWNFKRIKCCNGHILSVAKGIHLNCRSN